jgi:adenine-specific DNA-methyltransferase
VRYLGSKTLIAEKLIELISPTPGASFCDPFGGIATVSATAKTYGCRVVTGDILTCPYSFQVARIGYSRRPAFRRLRTLHGFDNSMEVVEHLNRRRSPSGWLVDEFAVKRQFFSRPNAEAIEGVWSEIGQWEAEGALSSGERSFLVASLVDSMDRVANTAGTYYAYLKSLSRKARRPFHLSLISPARGSTGCTAHLLPATDLVALEEWDVLYLDPPYNERCYSGYYHLPESISRLERPSCQGKSGTPAGTPRPRSDFNRPAKAVQALESVLAEAKAKKVVFHYSAEGLIPLSLSRELLSVFGTVREHTLTAPGYTTKHRERRSEHIVLVADRG